MRIENFSGIEVEATMVSTKKTTKIKGYEKKEVNMVVLPSKPNLSGEYVAADTKKE